MKTFAAVFCLLILAIAFVAPTNAQSHPAFAPYVTAGLSGSSDTGAVNPAYGAGVGIESNTSHWLLDGHFAFSTSDPRALTIAGIRSGSGYSTAEQVSIYYKFLGHVLAGGGANASVSPSNLIAIAKTGSAISYISAVRSNAHPFVGGGVEFGPVRFLVSYNLPGKDALPNERIFDANVEVRVQKHIRITAAARLESYFNGAAPAPGIFVTPVPYTQGNVRVTGTSLGGGIKFVL
jgi:hypothetical protein